jgi:hypothetical protein
MARSFMVERRRQNRAAGQAALQRLFLARDRSC